MFREHPFRQLNCYIFFADLDSDKLQDHEQAIPTRQIVQDLAIYQASAKVFAAHYNCGKQIVIDEAMVPFKGKLLFKQRIFGKPLSWGIKLFRTL